MRKIIIISIVLLLSLSSYGQDYSKTFEKINRHTVSIASDTSKGTGVLINKKDASGDINTFVLTAAHVLKDTNAPVNIIKIVHQKNGVTSRLQVGASIVKIDYPYDIALLLIQAKNFFRDSAVFYLDNKPLLPGTPLLHSGTFFAGAGTFTASVGIFSRGGISVNTKSMIYSQIAVPSGSGASGGGVYLADGRYVGSLTAVINNNYSIMAPIKGIDTWMKTESLEWLLDTNAIIPKDFEVLNDAE